MRIEQAVLIIIISGFTISCSTSTESSRQLSKTASEVSTSISAKTNLDSTTAKVPKSVARIKKSKIVNPKFSLDDVFGIWTTDQNGPHADFRLDSNSFYIVDYDGDGDMPYILKEDSLTIFFGDFISKNKILKVDKDSFILRSEVGVTRNVRWKD